MVIVLGRLLRVLRIMISVVGVIEPLDEALIWSYEEGHFRVALFCLSLSCIDDAHSSLFPTTFISI